MRDGLQTFEPAGPARDGLSRAVPWPTPVFVVFNPRSGKGRGRRLGRARAGRAARAAGAGRARRSPRAPGDEARAGRGGDRAAASARIVAVGGDGTWSNVGNAIIRVRDGRCAWAWSPAGTGCDLAQVPRHPRAGRRRAAPRIVARRAHARRSTSGRVEDRYFLNIVGFGFDIAVHRGLVDACAGSRGEPALPLLRAAAAPPVPRLPGGDGGGRARPRRAGSC